MTPDFKEDYEEVNKTISILKYLDPNPDTKEGRLLSVVSAVEEYEKAEGFNKL